MFHRIYEEIRYFFSRDCLSTYVFDIIQFGIPALFRVGYPISLFTSQTALPCPSKDLRGPAPGHPGVL